MKNHLRVFIFTVLFSFALIMPAYAVKTQFFTSIMDLPLIADFAELEDAILVFDKPDGRIVETMAIGVATKEKAMDFYLQTLPQLGWESIGEGRYVREDELLELDFSKNAEKTIIHVRLTPIKRIKK